MLRIVSNITQGVKWYNMKLVKTRNFYQNILKITIPIALQNLITLSTSMIDSLMLGRADDTGLYLSASSLANQPFFILSLVAFGLASASTVLTAQYWGKRDIEPIRRIISITIKTAMILSSIMGLAVLILPEAVMGIYSNNPEVIDAGASYLRIVGFSYFTFGFSSTMLCSIRSLEIVKISVVANLTSFMMNSFLNWVLIFGNLGAPALGIQGAAIATLTARVTELIITCIYIFAIDKRLNLKVRDLLSFDKLLAKDFLRYGLPVFLNELIWSMGISVQSAILGHIDYASGDPVAANSISGIVQQLSTVVIFGIANSAAVIVGKSIGAGHVERAKDESFTFTILSIVLGILACAVILVLKTPVISFYTVPEETKRLAHELMTVIAFVTIFVSIASTGIVGILRSGGDTKFCLILEMCALWCAAIPLALGASALTLPVALVLVFMKIDEPIKTLFFLLRMKTDRWITTLTR